MHGRHLPRLPAARRRLRGGRDSAGGYGHGDRETAPGARGRHDGLDLGGRPAPVASGHCRLGPGVPATLRPRLPRAASHTLCRTPRGVRHARCRQLRLGLPAELLRPGPGLGAGQQRQRRLRARMGWPKRRPALRRPGGGQQGGRCSGLRRCAPPRTAPCLYPPQGFTGRTLRCVCRQARGSCRSMRSRRITRGTRRSATWRRSGGKSA